MNNKSEKVVRWPLLVHKSTLKAVKAEAKKRKQSMSQLIRLAVEQLMKGS